MRRPGGCPTPPPTGRWRRVPPQALRRCATAARARIRASSAPSHARLTPCAAHFVAAGTSTAVAERASGRGSVTCMPGVAAAAAAVASAAGSDQESRCSGCPAPCRRPLDGWVAAAAVARHWRLREAARWLPPARGWSGGHIWPRLRRPRPQRRTQTALGVASVTYVCFVTEIGPRWAPVSKPRKFCQLNIVYLCTPDPYARRTGQRGDVP